MKQYLLPYPFKIAGIILSVAGVVMAVLYIWFDFRFKMPVFAVFSAFVESRSFVTFRTNFADELTLLMLVTGFAFIVLSKEKNETENLDLLRSKALFKAFILNTLLLLFSILFIYGSGFIGVLVFNIFSLSIIYLLFFYLQKK